MIQTEEHVQYNNLLKHKMSSKKHIHITLAKLTKSSCFKCIKLNLHHEKTNDILKTCNLFSE